MCLVQRPGNTNAETFNTIAATGRTVKTVDCDLADLDAVRTLFARALQVMQGQIHILVNCAGIQRRSPAVSFSEQDWDDVRTKRSFFLLTICYHLCIVLLLVRVLFYHVHVRAWPGSSCRNARRCAMV